MTSRSAYAASPEHRTSTRRVRWSRTAFQWLAWLFLAGIGVQVFLAGLGLFVAPGWWLQHRGFVHFLEALPLLLVVLAFSGHFPPSFRWLSAASFALIGIQYATIEIGEPAVAAYHPVNSLLLFWLTLTLAQRATRLNAA